ncbi:MAG: prolipoprotein diacylglyceryl transferase [Pirellulales bacterium]|nr:prolipoprotein diacylglyceryl transferase [Pirellulales bacterium]
MWRNQQPRHPTQIYESIFHATVAVVLFVFWRKHIFPGQLIKLYILAYAGYRFLTEMIRPEPQLWAGLTGYQWACLVIAGVFAVLWHRDADIFSEETGELPETQPAMKN